MIRDEPPLAFIGPVREALLTIYGRRRQTPGTLELLVSRRLSHDEALLQLLRVWHSEDRLTEIRLVLL